MNRNLTTAIVIIAIVALSAAGVWYFSNPQTSDSGGLTSITVAYSPFESTALLWVADDRHFFEQNGLNLTFRKYDSGAGSLDGVVNGEADITVGVTEFPLVRNAFRNVKVRAIGNIDKGYFTEVIARRDRGIMNISDLKGKRVGTTKGTVAEFHLGRFLNLHGMTMQDIELVDLRTPAEWVNEIVDGNIDAVATAQPYANSARNRLGDDAIVWSAQSSQPLFALVISTDTWITEHPETTGKFLRSLAQGEEYTIAHPAEAKSIIQKRLNLDPGYMGIVWKQNQFSLTLDHSLIAAMEDEARWMIANNLTDERKVPDFRKHIYTKGLDEIKPGSVMIIG